MFVQDMKFGRFSRTSKSAKVSDLVYVCPLWRWREPQQVRRIPLRYGLYYTKISQIKGRITIKTLSSNKNEKMCIFDIIRNPLRWQVRSPSRNSHQIPFGAIKPYREQMSYHHTLFMALGHLNFQDQCRDYSSYPIQDCDREMLG